MIKHHTQPPVKIAPTRAPAELSRTEARVIELLRGIRQSGRPGTLVIQVKQAGPGGECRGARIYACAQPEDT